MEEARFTLRIHPIIMEKMKYISKENGRSVNKEIEQILKWVVDDYERKYGRIDLAKKPKAATANADVKPYPERPMDMLFKLDK